MILLQWQKDTKNFKSEEKLKRIYEDLRESPQNNESLEVTGTK